MMNIEQFNPNNGNEISSYLERFESYCIANDIVKVDKKKATFFSLCGRETYNLIRTLTSPKNPLETEWEEIVAGIKKYFDPTPNIIVQRFKFAKRLQMPNETISEFITALKKIAEKCEFPDLEDRLRDALVCGILNGEIQSMLLMNSMLTFKVAQDMVLAHEAAVKNVAEIKDGKPQEEMNVLGRAVKTYIETWVKSERPRIEKDSTKLVQWNRQRLSILGKIKADVKVNKRSITMEFLVIEGPGPNLIGREAFDQIGIGFEWINYSDNEDGGTRNMTPVEFTRFATPIVPVLKRDGSIRICGDYRSTVNTIVESDTFPVPAAADLQVNLAGGKVFSKLDLKDAYQQLVVDEETAELLAINTHKGLFKVNRLPFGVSCAPGIFQRRMESLIAKIPGVVVYLDDILVTGKDEMEHDLRLREVLKSIQRMGLTLKKEKCEFKKSSLIFLGCRIDAEGIHPTEEKCEAIKNFPKPENKKELQSFLGLLNFYSKFLKDRTTVLEPLHRLLNKRNCWKWKEVEDRAFREAKNLIQSDLLLTPYDARKPLVLACDASPFGVGAVLSHVEERMERPIAFASRTMSQTERRYAQIDKEALAIIFGISKFYKYLYGRDFKIITDHKPLLGIFNPNKPIPQMLSPRMMRWSLTLASYSYQIEHRPGRMNANADALSRAPHEKTSKETPEPVDVFLMETNEESPLEAKEVAKSTQEDSVLGIIVEWTRIGWPAHCPAEKFRPYFNRRNELSLDRECLLWGNRVVIPPVLQGRTLEQLHETHPGIVQMKAIARSHVWWPGMDKAIENKVERCENCQLVRNNPKPSPVHPWTAPVKPWSRIHVDYAGPFHGRTFLIVVDSMSKWPEAIIMDHCTATATVRVLRSLFAVHGLPDQVVSDNGRMFVGHEFQEFLRMNRVRHITSAPYHPQTNGQAERVVQTLKQLIRKNGWENISVTLPRALFAMRTTPHGTTGLTPAELLMGRRLTTRMNRLHPKESEDSENGKEHFQNRFKSQENVYARKYNGKGKWEPGKIKTVLGPRNYEVIMENGVTAKRHQDQLMRRVKEEVSEDVEKKEECNTERRGEQMNDPNESPERLEETPGPSRPIRNRRLPEYLKDCVTNWGKLNKETVKDRYPLPLIEDEIDKLEASRIFSTIDLKNEFLHIPVAEESRKLTSFILKSEITYLGHEIKDGVIRPSNDKVAAVIRFPELKTIKQLQSFLGLTGYFRKFIKNYSIIAKPLSDMLKTNANFMMGPDQKQAFQDLKQILTNKPVLKIYQAWKWMIQTDTLIEKIRNAQGRDPLIKALLVIVKKKQVYDGYFEENNLLWKELEGDRTLVIPKGMEMEIIKRLSQKEAQEVYAQIDEWLKQGIIQKSNSEYANPIVLVKKKNGKTQICADYRKLNKETVKDRYPLPLIDDEIDKLEASRLFSTIDLKNEFLHIPVAEESRKLTSFILKSEITYLGHEIKDGVIRPSNDKVAAVIRFPELKTIRQLQSFLGLTGYFRKFIKNYSIIAKPLSDMLKTNANFMMGPDQKQAFQDLKQILTNKPVLKIYQEAQEVYAQIDEWLKQGIIQKSNSEYANPIVLVKKKNGKTQICVDYRKLNKETVKDRYPLPLIDDEIDKLEASRLFSTIDLKNEFLHIPVAEESRKLTSFILKSEITYLGQEIKDGVIRPSNDKVAAVIRFPALKTIRQLQSFLGLTGYFRKFIKNYSIIAKPLSDMLKTNANFMMGPDQKQAFQDLKQILTNKPVLKIYQVGARTELHRR
ncbi:K02A2.6-like [Cordylochernes scorpioides]|uniref:RNA-directed DNA polymerase n=1 Tax=Cordylochernes scorpioides TaxID=51811 RepID=A0ABY6LS29_9ARAC|nr:K02A2.6-like [Cordylochernes scorpioides]